MAEFLILLRTPGVQQDGRTEYLRTRTFTTARARLILSDRGARACAAYRGRHAPWLYLRPQCAKPRAIRALRLRAVGSAATGCRIGRRRPRFGDRGASRMRRLTRNWCGPADSVEPYQPSVPAGRTARR